MAHATLTYFFYSLNSNDMVVIMLAAHERSVIETLGRDCGECALELFQLLMIPQPSLLTMLMQVEGHHCLFGFSDVERK